MTTRPDYTTAIADIEAFIADIDAAGWPPGDMETAAKRVRLGLLALTYNRAPSDVLKRGLAEDTERLQRAVKDAGGGDGTT